LDFVRSQENPIFLNIFFTDFTKKNMGDIATYKLQITSSHRSEYPKISIIIFFSFLRWPNKYSYFEAG